MIDVSVLGATGSVGLSTAEVLYHHRDTFCVDGLSAHSNWRQMHKLCLQLQPRRVALENLEAANQLRRLLQEAGLKIAVDGGAGAGERLAAEGAETLVAAVTGVAGLPALRSAVLRGARILLANKEALVVGGDLLLREAAAAGAQILPLDSEHNAIFQCLAGQFTPGEPPPGIASLTLTASGGPFLHTSISDLAAVTPEQAVRHPTWDMGAKISVDSATLMNKGLELIEASVLFGLPASQLHVLIHPQSLVHALVAFIDGSVLAQMAQPDMRVPIANGLAWPKRLETTVPPLQLAQLPDLQFAQPDMRQFPCLGLALDALRAGGTAPVILNAANEEAVRAFLAGGIGFVDIAPTVDRALQHISAIPCDNFKELLELDERVRAFCRTALHESLPKEQWA